MKNNIDFFISDKLRKQVADDIIQKLKWIYLLYGYDYEVQFWLDATSDKNGAPMQGALMWVYSLDTDLFAYEFEAYCPVSDVAIEVKSYMGMLIMGELDNFAPYPLWDFVTAIKVLIKAICIEK